MTPPTHARTRRRTKPSAAPETAPPPAGGPTTHLAVDGHFAVDTWVRGATYSAVAYAVVPKVAGARWYTVSGSGFHDPAYYGRSLSLTFSAGVTGCLGQGDIDSAIERADQAMYRAKQAGRDRIEAS